MNRLALFVTIGLSVGCATEESTFTGALTLSSFPADVTGVVAVASDATETLASVDADGAFAIALPTEDDYTLFVETADGRVPIALRVSGASFGTVLSLGMGSATVDLGAMSYISTITVKADVEAPEQTEPPTISEDATVVCEDEPDGDGGHRKGGRHGGRNEVTEVLLTDAPAFVLPTYALEPRVGCGC